MKKIVSLLVLIYVGMFLNGCANVDSTDKLSILKYEEDYAGKVRLDFKLPSQHIAKSIKAAFVDTRDQVITKITASISGSLNGEGFTKSIDLTIDADRAYGVIDYVFVGSWTLNLKAYNKDNQLLAGGTSALTITENTTTAASVNMTYYQVGGADISVTWEQNTTTTTTTDQVTTQEPVVEEPVAEEPVVEEPTKKIKNKNK